MTTLVVGENALASGLLLAAQYGGRDFRQFTSDDRRWGSECGATQRDRLQARVGELARELGASALVDATSPYRQDISAALHETAAEIDLPLVLAVPPSVAMTRFALDRRFVSSADALLAMTGDVNGSVAATDWPLERHFPSEAREMFVLPGLSDALMPESGDLPSWLVTRAQTALRQSAASKLLCFDAGDLNTLAYLAAADVMRLPATLVRRPPVPTGQSSTPSATSVVGVLRRLNQLACADR
jgi:hypothetical protein